MGVASDAGDLHRGGVERGELQDGDKDHDVLLVEGVEALEAYLNEHERACLKLKQGFLKMTKARMRLPAHALGELSYRESFEVSRVVTVNADGDWELRLPSEVGLDAAGDHSENPSLHQRRAGKLCHQSDVQSSQKPATELNADTLLWFSSLPPSDLRQAQKQFASGLEALLASAASARKVQIVVHQAANAPQ